MNEIVSLHNQITYVNKRCQLELCSAFHGIIKNTGEEIKIHMK